MAASPWVSELLAAESASLAIAKRSGRLLGFSALAACIALVFTIVRLLSMHPRGGAFFVTVAIVTTVLFLVFAIWGYMLQRRASTLRKHALALFQEHGPLTAANTTLTQLQAHLAGWTVARDTPQCLHLLHKRTPAAARLIKFVQIAAGLVFCALFAVTIWHNGWSLAGVGSGASSYKLKLIVYAMPLIGAFLALAALVPSPVQLLLDRDTGDELLLESVSLLGTRAQMLPLAEITAFAVNDAGLVAFVSPPARMMLMEFSVFHAMNIPKPLKPLYENIAALRKQLLHDAFTRVTNKPVEII